MRHYVLSVKNVNGFVHFRKKYIVLLGKKIVGFQFRDKSKGWKLFGKILCENEDGTLETRYFEPEEPSYYQMFLNFYTYRENCYSCPYACDNRQGDITIGDYWCAELVHPELISENGGPLEHENGTSCMIINNIHGQEMLRRFGEGIEKMVVCL